jgi:hypothetical protein
MGSSSSVPSPFGIACTTPGRPKLKAADGPDLIAEVLTNIAKITKAKVWEPARTADQKERNNFALVLLSRNPNLLPKYPAELLDLLALRKGSLEVLGRALQETGPDAALKSDAFVLLEKLDKSESERWRIEHRK